MQRSASAGLSPAGSSLAVPFRSAAARRCRSSADAKAASRRPSVRPPRAVSSSRRRRTRVERSPCGSMCPSVCPALSPCRRARSSASASRSGGTIGALSSGQATGLQTTPCGSSSSSVRASSMPARREPGEPALPPSGTATRSPGSQNSSGNSSGRV